MIIAFSGNKFAGKDTAAEALIRSYGFKRIGLADKLKDICSEVFEISRKDMDNPDLKEKQFSIPISINPTHIDSLLTTLQRDGYVFDYDAKYETIFKSFQGKNLKSIRDMLQVVGTDICRTYIKDDLWLTYIQNFIKTFDGSVVITDARFKNERDYLKNLGAILILVKRPGLENTSSHISENQLGDDSEYDVVITNDDSITCLQSSVNMWFSVKQHAIKSNFKR